MAQAPYTDKAAATKKPMGFMQRLARKSRLFTTVSMVGLLGSIFSSASARPLPHGKFSQADEVATSFAKTELAKPVMKDLYEEAVKNPAVSHRLEMEAMDILREKAKPVTTFDGVKFTAPIGDGDFSKLTHSAAGPRRISFYGGVKKFHGAIDLGTGGTKYNTPVRAPETMIVKVSKEGFFWGKSLDGKRDHKMEHLKSLDRAGLINPATGEVFKEKDTILEGSVFSKLGKYKSPVNGKVYPAHLHWSVWEDGKLQVKKINRIKAQNGLYGETVTKDSDYANGIGWYAAQGLVNNKSIDEMRDRVHADNQKQYGVNLSESAMLDFIIDKIEGGSSDKDGGTRYGITGDWNKEELAELNVSVHNLTKKQAKKIYFKKYVKPLRLNELTSGIDGSTAEGKAQIAATKLLVIDASIQLGTAQALAMVKQAQDEKGVIDLDKFYQLRVNDLEEKGTSDRVRRMGLIQDQYQLLAGSANAPLKGAYAFRDKKLDQVEKDLMETKQEIFVANTQKQQQKDLLAEEKTPVAPLNNSDEKIIIIAMARDEDKHQQKNVLPAGDGPPDKRTYSEERTRFYNSLVQNVKDSTASLRDMDTVIQMPSLQKEETTVQKWHGNKPAFSNPAHYSRTLKKIGYRAG